MGYSFEVVTRGARQRAEIRPVEPDLVRTSEGMSRMMRSHVDFLQCTATSLTTLRQAAPLVQCLTNSVTTNLVANALLAVGASPAMVDVPGEAGPFAQVAGALYINLGTPAGEQREAMLEAAASAHTHGTPWVLDPVAVGVLPVRTALAAELLELRPTVIRGNASEIRALAGHSAAAKGVDATDEVESARTAALELAHRWGTVVAVSGEVDLVTNGDSLVRVANGTQLFTRVTGAGCALGGVVAAYTAVLSDAFAATVAASLHYALAGELAARRAGGPGSFSPAFLDQLFLLDDDAVLSLGRLP